MPTTVSFSNAGLEAHCRALQDTLNVNSIDDLLVLDSGELRGAGLDDEAQATLFEALRQRQLQLQTDVGRALYQAPMEVDFNGLPRSVYVKSALFDRPFMKPNIKWKLLDLERRLKC